MTEKKTVDLAGESDRGCVLVGAALLEERLEELFRAVFNRNSASKKLQDSLFESNGPLATFSAKVKLAYSLGLVDKSIFDDLETVRRIRNEFAHSAEEVDFSGSSFASEIKAMHSVQQFKDRMQCFSPTIPPAKNASDTEAHMRVAGYLKYTKAIFSLGVSDMAYQIRRRTVSFQIGPSS